MAIVLKHPYCGQCAKFPCIGIKKRLPKPEDQSKGIEQGSWDYNRVETAIIYPTDRGQWCGGKDFEHIGCFDKSHKKVRDLTFTPQLIADDIMYDFHFATVGDIIYVYKDGTYIPEGEKIIRNEAQKRLRDDIAEAKEQDDDKKIVMNHKDKIECSTFRKNEVVGWIRDQTHISITGYPEKQPPHLINLKNGFFNLKTWELEPHTPDIFSVSQIPIMHNPPLGDLAACPGAKCPIIEKFFSEILDPKDIETILELFGYCLYADYPIHRSFLMQGEGSNGKSVLLSLLTTFIGEDNCASKTLQQLSGGDRFSGAHLFGKHANINNDLSDTALKDTGTFKQLTGQDKISAEFKFKDGFSFRNYAKLIFACNRVPITPDDTEAFMRRMFIIRFSRTFTEQTADKFLIQKLTTPEELEGLLLIALDHLKRLLERGQFANSPTIDEMRDLYTRLSDSVGAFLNDCAEANSNHCVVKTVIYNVYAAYCRKKHYRIVHENFFHKRLKTLMEVYEEKKKVGMQRVMVWWGLKLKRSEPRKTEENVEGVDTSSNSEPKNENSEKIPSTPSTSFSSSADVQRVERVDTKNHISPYVCVGARGGVGNTLDTLDTVDTSESKSTSRVGETRKLDHCLDCGMPFLGDDDNGGESGMCTDCLAKRTKKRDDERRSKGNEPSSTSGEESET